MITLMNNKMNNRIEFVFVFGVCWAPRVINPRNCGDLNKYVARLISARARVCLINYLIILIFAHRRAPGASAMSVNTVYARCALGGAKTPKLNGCN